MCIIIVCNSDTTFTYLRFTYQDVCETKTSEMCWMYMYIYICFFAHVDTLYTCYLFYYVFLSYHLFVEFGQCMVHIRSQLKTTVISSVFLSISTEVQTTSPMRQQKRKRTGEILELHRHFWPDNSHVGPFLFKRNSSFQNQKTKSVFCRKPTIFCFGQLSFSLLFLFVDVVYRVYIYTRKYVYTYVYK